MRNIKSSDDFTKIINKDKVLLIYFATGCSACKKEFEMVSRNYSKFSSEIKIYAVSAEQEDVIKKFAEENNFDFPILIDRGANLLGELKIKSFPTNFVLRNGVIEKTWIGNIGGIESLAEKIRN